MIKLKNLERRYPLGKEKFFYVLRDINLDIAEGEFVSVMGPSGAGKSTLLHILGMHDHGWEGEYFLNETAVHHLKPKERATLRNDARAMSSRAALDRVSPRAMARCSSASRRVSGMAA